MRTIQYIGVGIIAIALTAETIARILKEMREWKPTGGNQ